MTKEKRWQKAQTYEERFWQKRFPELIIEDRKKQLFENAAMSIEEKIDKMLNKNSRILEIGPGPVGVINNITKWTKYSLDPLEESFKTLSFINEVRNQNVCRIAGRGEMVPFKDKVFDLIIATNMLDHTQEPELVLFEMQRVLKPEGYVYLQIGVYTPLAYKIRKMIELFQLDKGHPHSFMKSSINNLLRKIGFEIIEVLSYETVRRINIQSKNIKKKLVGYLGISENHYVVLIKKKR